MREMGEVIQRGARDLADDLDRIADIDSWSMANAITRTHLNRATALLREQADTIDRLTKERNDAEALARSWIETARTLAIASNRAATERAADRALSALDEAEARRG